jgi:hypothetical protein
VLKITGTDRNAQSFFEYRAIAPDEYYYTFAKCLLSYQNNNINFRESGFKHEFGDWYINRPAEGIDDGLPFLRYHHADSLLVPGKK